MARRDRTGSGKFSVAIGCKPDTGGRRDLIASVAIGPITVAQPVDLGVRYRYVPVARALDWRRRV
jgi:hypothetical protein